VNISMDTSPRRVLVTGATGFLGRNILNALMQAEGIELIAACRKPSALPENFAGERRVGDLLDPEYRRSVVKNIDVVCHAGTWGSMWGHERQERENFLAPTTDLMSRAIDAGVQRFLMTSTNVVASPPVEGFLNEDSGVKYTKFWPHLDRLMDVERYMQSHADGGTTMVAMRLGHFVGAGNVLGLVPALAPRLRTRLVPYIDGGSHRLSLIADEDLGSAFRCAVMANGLRGFEVFNICGASFPTTKEIVEFISDEAGVPRPWFSVSARMAYAFGFLMEKLHPFMPGKAPFLTRSIVYLSEDWPSSTERAARKLGFAAQKDWKIAMREAIVELRAKGFPWPRLA